MKSNILILLMILLFPATLMAEPLMNTRALSGLHSANTIFDVNQGNPKKLLLRLNLIEETIKGMAAEGVKGDVVVAFRGKASFFITKGKKYITADEAGIKDKIQIQVKKLKKMGYTLEQCAVATRLLKIDNADIMPEIKIVSNGYISMIGYQNKGYGMVPME